MDASPQQFTLKASDLSVPEEIENPFIQLKKINRLLSYVTINEKKY